MYAWFRFKKELLSFLYLYIYRIYWYRFTSFYIKNRILRKPIKDDLTTIKLNSFCMQSCEKLFLMVGNSTEFITLIIRIIFFILFQRFHWKKRRNTSIFVYQENCVILICVYVCYNQYVNNVLNTFKKIIIQVSFKI